LQIYRIKTKIQRGDFGLLRGSKYIGTCPYIRINTVVALCSISPKRTLQCVFVCIQLIDRQNERRNWADVFFLFCARRRCGRVAKSVGDRVMKRSRRPSTRRCLLQRKVVIGPGRTRRGEDGCRLVGQRPPVPVTTVSGAWRDSAQECRIKQKVTQHCNYLLHFCYVFLVRPA
jgi:hypothetical protein